MTGSSSRSKTIFLPPSARELAIQDIIVALSQGQLGSVDIQRAFQAEQLGAARTAFQQLSEEERIRGQVQTPEITRDLLQGDLSREVDTGRAIDRLRTQELERLETGALTPQQEANLAAQSQAAFAAGAENIQGGLRRGLETLREELAPAAGLRGTDTPIQDRGGRLAEEALRQEGQLARAVSAEELGQRVSLPFQSSQAAQNFQGALSQFRTDLRQQGFANRLQLGQQAGQQGIGLASTGAIGEIGSTLGAFKPAQGTLSKSTSGGFCWVAAEFFGWETPDWHDARRWIVDGWKTTTGRTFLEFYKRFGRQLAWLVRHSHLVRGLLHPLFVWARDKGREMR